MCIICSEEYDETLTKLDCSNCRLINKIPKTLINLVSLDCHNCKNIYLLPKQLIKLRVLTISYTNISSIPSSYSNLQYIKCDNSEIKSLPKTLINLKYLYCFDTKIKKIPKEFIELLRVIYFRSGVKSLPKELTKLIKDGVEEKKTEMINISGPKNIQDPNKRYQTSCSKCNKYYNDKQYATCNHCKENIEEQIKLKLKIAE